MGIEDLIENLREKIEKRFRYKMLKINRNSLVAKGAMQVKPLYKSKDGSFTNVNESVLLKSDDEKQELTTIMVLFNKFDSDNMVLDKEDVRDLAMIDFMKNGDKQVYVTHNQDQKDRKLDAFIKELFVVPENHENYKDYAGSIAQTIKFFDKEDYEIAKSLNLETSFEGNGELEEIMNKDLKSIIKNNIKEFSKYISEELLEKIIGDEKMLGKSKKKEALVKQINELQKELEVLEKEKDEQEQSNDENKEVITNLMKKNDELSEKLEKIEESLKKEVDEKSKAIEDFKKEMAEIKKNFLEKKTPNGENTLERNEEEIVAR